MICLCRTMLPVAQICQTTLAKIQKVANFWSKISTLFRDSLARILSILVRYRSRWPYSRRLAIKTEWTSKVISKARQIGKVNDRWLNQPMRTSKRSKRWDRQTAWMRLVLGRQTPPRSMWQLLTILLLRTPQLLCPLMWHTSRRSYHSRFLSCSRP